jgi:hypothetical protein
MAGESKVGPGGRTVGGAYRPSRISIQTVYVVHFISPRIVVPRPQSMLLV